MIHLLFLQVFLPERWFSIFSKGVLAIWKNRKTFSSSLRPSVSLCLQPYPAGGEGVLLRGSRHYVVAGVIVAAGWLVAGVLPLAAGEIPGNERAPMTESGTNAVFSAATAEQLARNFLAGEAIQVTHVKAFRMPPSAAGWWMVEYQVAGRPVHGSGPYVFVNEKTREVTRQAPRGAPPRL